jgi:CRISPR-associated protein Cmr4
MSLEASKLMFIYALSPLHPGAGRVSAPSPVDLPVQRDEFGFPTIWSSSLKGVLRSSFQLKARSAQDNVDRAAGEAFVRAVFGPEPASPEVSEYASSISLLDARLLLVPARSLKGIWVYLTSPHLLAYYRTYLEAAVMYSPRLDGHLKKLTDLIRSVEQKLHDKGPDADRLALVSDEDCVIKSGEKLSAVLNEEVFSAEVFKDLAELWKVLPDGIERKSIAAVSDNAARSLVRKSLVVQPRVRLDYEKKTVARGGLWDEEYLPQRTLLVTAAFARAPRQNLENLAKRAAESYLKSRQPSAEQSSVKDEELTNLTNSVIRKIGSLTADKVLERLSEQKFVVLGGKETIGKGIAKLLWY